MNICRLHAFSLAAAPRRRREVLLQGPDRVAGIMATRSVDVGPGFALCVEGCADSALLALATSERVLGLRDRVTLTAVNQLANAHDARINELCFSGPHTLYSASSDGRVRLWDPSAACLAPVREIPAADDGSEVWSVSVEPEAHLVATGTETAVVLWDVRRLTTPLARYEVHTEAVTQVRFRPGSAAAPSLLTGSMDGLLCEIDCRVTDEDDAVVGTHNTESPVTALGFFCGAGAPSDAPCECAWALSSTDAISLWNLVLAERLGSFDNLVPHLTSDHLTDGPTGAKASTSRAASSVAASSAAASLSAATAAMGSLSLAYVVGCAWDVKAGRLLMLGGDADGTGRTFEVRPDGIRHVGTMPAASRPRGHNDRIRAFHYVQADATFVTGAEDGVVCLWPGETRGAPSPAGARSAKSSAAAMGKAEARLAMAMGPKPTEESPLAEEATGAPDDDEAAVDDGPAAKKIKRPKDKEKWRVKPY